MKKLSFDSTPTLKGIVFQFLVALDRCFEMRDGESVYIETFGDVSVLGGNDSTQIESKYYKRAVYIPTIGVTNARITEYKKLYY